MALAVADNLGAWRRRAQELAPTGTRQAYPQKPAYGRLKTAAASWSRTKVEVRSWVIGPMVRRALPRPRRQFPRCREIPWTGEPADRAGTPRRWRDGGPVARASRSGRTPWPMDWWSSSEATGRRDG